jgi:uncharacterized membrane protein
MVHHRRFDHPAIWISMLLILLAGAVLALAWWDWFYPGLIWAWWRGERIYRFFWRQLGLALVACESVCLGLWNLSARARDAHHQIVSSESPAPHPWPRAGNLDRTQRHPQNLDRREKLNRAARPFLLAILALPFFARYTYHPLGVQHGSSVWTYLLTTVSAVVLAFPLTKIVLSVGPLATPKRWGWRLVCLLSLSYALVFGTLSIARHISFQTHALDLGTMDQAAWNTIQGRILERTPLYRDPADGSRYENRLLDAKLELILIPLSALYWLWPDPRVLLVVQTLFLAAGAVPLYLLIYGRASSSEQARPRLLALLLSATYLLYLPLHYVNMAEFHPSALMVPFLIAAWLAMRQNQWRLYYVWLALALSCRIDAAFAALALGLVIVARCKGKRRHGLYTLAIAMIWLALDFGAIVPAVRQVYGPGAGNLVARRFGTWGNGPIQILNSLLTRPAFVLAQFVDREKLQVIFDLLAPLGFTPLLYPPALLPALPILAINLLAESTWQHSIHAHYMAPILPFIWIAVAEGLTGLPLKRSPERVLSLATFALLNTTLIAYAFSPFPPGRAFRLADIYQPSRYKENLRTVIAHVPGSASVCAQSDIHPHLSQRRDACLFPRCQLGDGQETDYVIVDLDPTSVKSPLGYHAFYEQVNGWLERSDYGVVALEGGALLLQRGASRENVADVLAALDEYGRQFYRVEYLQIALPARLSAGELYRVPVKLRNAGSGCWRSQGQLPVRLSYRWRTEDGPLLTVQSLHTGLSHRVEPGNKIQLQAWLLTPAEPGTYTLEWDIVRQGDAWFGDMGATTLQQSVSVR